MGKRLAVTAIWLMGLILQVGAVEIVAGPEITAAETTAKIEWKTDVECGTRARYGPSPEKLEQKVEGGVSQEHSVLLTGLKPATEYHYSVGTARYVLKTGSFKTVGKGTQDSPVKPVVPASAAVVKKKVPPTRETWANTRTLEDHFERHGHDFAATSADDYARQAWEFFERAKDEGLPAKYDESDGTFRVYDPKTGDFAAYNNRGKTKTYFKPGSRDYFQRQPGKIVRIRR